MFKYTLLCVTIDNGYIYPMTILGKHAVSASQRDTGNAAYTQPSLDKAASVDRTQYSPPGMPITYVRFPDLREERYEFSADESSFVQRMQSISVLLEDL